MQSMKSRGFEWASLQIVTGTLGANGARSTRITLVFDSIHGRSDRAGCATTGFNIRVGQINRHGRQRYYIDKTAGRRDKM